MSAAPRRRDGRPGRDLTRFAAVDAWVFDLDNTLYPRHANLFQQVDKRIREYVGRLLELTPEEAQRVQKDYYRRYGTTLRGLMEEHGIRPTISSNTSTTSTIRRSSPIRAWRRRSTRLPGRKFILTNGSRAHAEKVAERLGIPDHFEDIFDIVRSELLPKPNRETYDRFLAVTGVDPTRAAMFEDLARNLEVPKALGMATVLVVPQGAREVLTEDWEMEGRDAAHVDFVADDLAGFIETVLAARAGRRDASAAP